MKIRIKIKGVFANKSVSYTACDFEDILSLIEIYVLREYEWLLDPSPRVILDLGANFGDTALYYNCIYPSATIVSVEPDPQNFKKLKENVALIENIVTVNAAVGPKSGSITLYPGKSGLGNSIVNLKNVPGITVTQMTIPEILGSLGGGTVDLVKFDIEGAEFDLLKSIELENLSKAYIGELHFDLVDGVTLENVKEMFKNFNLEIKPLENKHRFIIKASR